MAASLNELSPAQRREFVRKLQSDPVFHIEKLQGVATLEDYQRRICRAIVEHDRVAVAACHDVGKTFTLSKIVLWFGSAFPGAKIITTAPTFTQVEKLLWSEIRNGYRLSKAPLGGRMLQTEWKIREDWFAVGISPKDDAGDAGGQGKTSGFQGFHGDHILVIFDEATGVNPKRWIQAEGMMTSAHVKWVAIANPTSKNSEFYNCFRSPAWHKVYISCFDSPNLTVNGVHDLQALRAEVDLVRSMPEEEAQRRLRSYRVVQPRLLTLTWVVAMAIKWGIEHPLFQSKVMGQFPDEDDNVLMPLGAVERAQAREYEPRLGDKLAVGVDVARFGSDRSVITILHGTKLIRKKVLVKKDTGDVAGHTIAEIRSIMIQYPEMRPDQVAIAIDGTGVGAGVVDQLRQAQREGSLGWGVQIHEVNFGEGFKYIKNDRERIECERLYVNRKAKLMVQLSQDLKENLSLSEDGVYLEELPTIIYRFDSKARYVIESKEDYKKRTGRPSPDETDSLALANEARRLVAESVTILKPAPGRTHAPSLVSGDQW